MNIDLNYWREAAREVLNNKYAKVGFKVVEGAKVFKPATSAALQRIRYNLDKITKREFDEYGCFAVFTAYKWAESFRINYGQHILLVGYIPCKGVSKGYMWKKNPPEFVRSSWKGGTYYAQSSGTTEFHVNRAPRGTVLAEAIYVFGVIE